MPDRVEPARVVDARGTARDGALPVADPGALGAALCCSSDPELVTESDSAPSSLAESDVSAKCPPVVRIEFRSVGPTTSDSHLAKVSSPWPWRGRRSGELRAFGADPNLCDACAYCHDCATTRYTPSTKRSSTGSVEFGSMSRLTFKCPRPAVHETSRRTTSVIPRRNHTGRDSGCGYG